MKPSTWSKPMPETMPNARAWRLDPVGAHPASSEMDEMARFRRPAPAPGRVIAAGGPLTTKPKPGSLLRQWHQVVRTWGRERLKGLGGRAARFEAALHDFTGIIETAENPVAVEAALLRHAQRMVPACRIELIAGPVPCTTTSRSPRVTAWLRSGKRARQALATVGMMTLSGKCRYVAARLSEAGSASVRGHEGWLR